MFIRPVHTRDKMHFGKKDPIDFHPTETWKVFFFMKSHKVSKLLFQVRFLLSLLFLRGLYF